MKVLGIINIVFGLLLGGAALILGALFAEEEFLRGTLRVHMGPGRLLPLAFLMAISSVGLFVAGAVQLTISGLRSDRMTHDREA